MNDEYYILENGEKMGPFSFNELIKKGIEIDTSIATSSAGEWQNASYLPEFNEYFESQGFYFPTEDNLAGFGWRMLAFFIDYIIVSLIAVIIILKAGWVTFPTSPALNMAFTNIMSPKAMMIIEANFAFVFLVYHTLCEASKLRGSVGKKICGLKVVDADGKRINIIKALARNLGAFLSFMLYGLPFFTLFFSAHKQTWYDRLAKTYMIKIEQ
jgi:uncharacterized RDD family membrane protein YckC